MIVQTDTLINCVTGVLLCRGYEEEAARRMADAIRTGAPNQQVVSIVKEVSSVFLTLEAHGKMKTDAN